jgi:protocatechuate 3,4-dioxygenase beta subunit
MNQKENGELNRRAALLNLGKAGAGVFVASVVASKVSMALESSLPTPAQVEGPFYPVKDQLDKDADMTRVKGRQGFAKGDVIKVLGEVIDVDSGQVIPGAVVEFWQACATGRYNHPRDPNTAVLDRDFQYWAQVQTDENGGFSIKTIVPGAYPAGNGWIRPPHIHVKVHVRGYPSLTTQLYFKDHPLNEKDLILQKLTPAQQDLVILKV